MRHSYCSGWFAPRGTPADIVAKLNRAINEIVVQPEVRERLVAVGTEVTPMSVEQFTSFVRAETRKNADLLSEDFCSQVLYGGCSGFDALQQAAGIRDSNTGRPMEATGCFFNHRSSATPRTPDSADESR